MRRAAAGAFAALASGAVAGGVVLATQLGGGAATPTPTPTSPGQVHASEVHAWVACKAQNGKGACTKPTPPGHLKVKPHGHDDAKDESDESDEPD